MPIYLDVQKNNKMKKNKLVLFLVLVLVLKIGSVCNQTFHQSPCPDIFSYESDGSSVYGRIVLRGKTPLSRIELQANFAVAGYLSDYGSIEVENARYALQDYNRGLPMQYRVRFTVTSPLPMVTSIIVNGKTICRGQKLIPRPNQVVTNFNLKQTTFQQTTGQDFDVVQPQPNPYDVFGGFLTEGQNLPNQDENTFNTLNIWSNQAVQEKPTRKPTKPLELQNPVFIEYYSQEQTSKPPRPVASNPFQDEEFDGYYPPKQTTRPPQPVTTKRPVQQQPESEPNVECGTRSSENDRLALVYNGKSYMRGDLPWLAAIYRKKGSSLSFVCGGTLVSNRHVVTAAHCMSQKSERTSMNNIVVKVGVHQLDDWDDEIAVTRTLIDATIHESFNSTTLQNDILVLTFSKRVKFNSFIRPACLWNGNKAIERIVGASGIVAGWGTKKNEGAGVGEPHMINVPIINSDVCRSSNLAFNQISADKSFCAGDRNGNGPCTGDSGGGFYLSDGGKWRLRGIVSFSLRSQDGQCNLNDYVVFTDTAQYLPWIRQALGKQYFD